MGSKMLVDATHPEETRVVVVRGNRIEEFDFESAARKQLKGNIYLAKVTRVEPSLQAAFVEYGGNRHGFLAFSEIHPDYYQIPVADRQALLREQEEDDAEEREDDNDDDNTNNEPEPSGEAQALQDSEEPQLASEVIDAEEAEEEQPAEEETASESEVQAQEAPAIGEAGVGVETVEEDAESQKVESIGAEDAL
jgi:ribonuclease E